MWESEQKFSHYLIKRLKDEGFTCNRIETHGTLNGMPDMFVQGHGMDTFIELKNMKNISVNDERFKVQWRPGQVAWATIYRNTHMHDVNGFDTTRCSWTFIGCSDGIIALPMWSNFMLNEVNLFDIRYTIDRCTKIKDLLMAHSQLVMPSLCPSGLSMRSFIYDTALQYQYLFAGSAVDMVDWPDVNIIARSIDMHSKELNGFAPADYDYCKVLSSKIASVIYSCYDNWLLNK